MPRWRLVGRFGHATTWRLVGRFGRRRPYGYRRHARHGRKKVGGRTKDNARYAATSQGGPTPLTRSRTESVLTAHIGNIIKDEFRTSIEKIGDPKFALYKKN